MDVAVVGAGSWGTALAKVLADKGSRVTLWGRSPEQLADIGKTRMNGKYLPNAKLPDTLTPEPDLLKAVEGKPFVVSVVPSHTVRDVLGRAGKAMDPAATVISAS
jgi:glycerol-3-phosphate dehydrogenase (NAD(P)+)